MNEFGKKAKNASLEKIGITNASSLFWNLSPAELIEDTILQGDGELASNGALVVDTGEFKGRSPKDRFIVYDEITADKVWWGDVNIKFDSEKFENLHKRMLAYATKRDLYVRDAYVGTSRKYRTNLRVVTEKPWSNLFAYNLFLRPTDAEIENFEPEWHILCLPDFKAVPEIDGTRQHNFAILNFSKKLVLIGGTGYTGEIKKSIFSMMNFVLPTFYNVLPMHCSANVGVNNDTALFFGLSGTGKTTLSADAERQLIGDDEHGWSDHEVFNFEGGCYAKCINLSAEKEPQIFRAIKFGSLVENTEFHKGTREIDYDNGSKTENTRVSYPIDYIDNIVLPSLGPQPKNIFFLTADAFGVLPPISKLTPEQAMYHFISGYTAKVAGTEMGVIEPQLTFSTCFGAPFMPLHPSKYAELLGEKIKSQNVRVWLINTGWTGGPYGVGSRISLKYTRAMIKAAITGELDNVEYVQHEIFGLHKPQSCPGVPAEVLNPRNTWADKAAYDAQAMKLANSFHKNFEKFSELSSEAILSGGPRVTAQ